MLRYRLITGPILIVAILALVWLDAALTTSNASAVGSGGGSLPRGAIIALLGLLITPLVAYETSRLLEQVGVASRAWLAMASAVAAYVVVASLPFLGSASAAAGLAATLLVVILVASLITFSRGQNVKGVMAATGGVLLVTVYAGVLLAFFPLIRLEHSGWVLVGAVLTTKSCDIGAYFTGMSVGRTKLIEWLSPKKTWEGLIGGVAAATLVGSLLAWWSAALPDPADHLPVWLGAVGGLLVGIVGQFGDLAESLFKRDAGVKDSGRSLPGMGGILDVLDSPLLTGPVVYWLLTLVGPHGVEPGLLPS